MENDITEEVRNIEEDIKQSGFPLEIEVSSILKKDGWIVRNQAYYIDEDEEKPRAVDIVAHKSFFEKFSDHDRLHISLVIECKKGSKPWVFFVTPKEEARMLPFGYIKHWANPALEYSIYFSQWMEKMFHYACVHFKEHAIIAYEPFKKEKRQEIFEAKNQVIKALNFELEERKKAPLKLPMRPVFILYPVIVYDGHLFEYKSQNGDMKIVPSDYLQYSVEQKEFFLIDVVRKEYLSQYLKMINQEIEALRLSLKQ